MAEFIARIEREVELGIAKPQMGERPMAGKPVPKQGTGHEQPYVRLEDLDSQAGMPQTFPQWKYAVSELDESHGSHQSARSDDVYYWDEACGLRNVGEMADGNAGVDEERDAMLTFWRPNYL